MRTTQLRAFIVGAYLMALLPMASSCGSDQGSGANRNGDGGAGAAGGIGKGDGGIGQQCSGAADCSMGWVCHPAAGTCVNPGQACAGPTDCGTGTFCDTAAGACLSGTTGSPCTTDANCADPGASCTSGVCGCSGLAQAQEPLSGPLDIYFVFDRTASMGEDCAYQPGDTPPVASKACFATYALADYAINVAPIVDTRLAFQFMSQPDDCDGTPYTTPLIPLTTLPIAANHGLIQAISDETFQGGLGTHIEGALRGIAGYTASNVTPGREMIGVLMTDGDPNGCEEDIPTLSRIIADHLAATGIRTFVIGMDGATDANLEELGRAGGAEPHSDWCGSVAAPCHYWNVGNGSGDAIASALQAIIQQSVPLPCEFDVATLEAPQGEDLDYKKVNVTLTAPGGAATTIVQVLDQASCPTDQPAWYYDDPASPKTVNLCKTGCDTVTGSAAGSRVTIVVGCQDTITLR